MYLLAWSCSHLIGALMPPVGSQQLQEPLAQIGNSMLPPVIPHHPETLPLLLPLGNAIQGSHSLLHWSTNIPSPSHK